MFHSEFSFELQKGFEKFSFDTQSLLLTLFFAVYFEGIRKLALKGFCLSLYDYFALD